MAVMFFHLGMIWSPRVVLLLLDQTLDDRVPQGAKAVASALTPDYALGGHTASLGLCWVPAGTLPGFPDGLAIGQHGSWNRSTLSGYKLVFVPFENGQPSGPPRDILSGSLSPDERMSYRRPVGVSLGTDGRSLLMGPVLLKQLRCPPMPSSAAITCLTYQAGVRGGVLGMDAAKPDVQTRETRKSDESDGEWLGSGRGGSGPD